MRCPTLQELPPPPLGRSGWPWTEESPQLTNTMPDGSLWPRISIVTPSFNQGQFIEETIRSVLLQGYPNLEYIIIDGGSKDASIEIIKKYEKSLTYWESRPDKGQSHAINKGWTRSSGTLLGWLNSDDLLLPETLKVLGEAHKGNPNALIAGDVINFFSFSSDTTITKQFGLTLKNFAGNLHARFSWHQPGIYFPGDVLASTGPLDESLHYCFDYDLMCRVLQYATAYYLKIPVAKFRIHPESKNQSFPVEAIKKEERTVARRYSSFVPRAMEYWLVQDGIDLLKSGKIIQGLSKFIRGSYIHPLGAIIDFTRGVFNLMK
jgi:glycosyltransferase involved in cell wall biosynthesis